jgi:hypothetical protein
MKYMALIYDRAPTGDEPMPGTPEFDAYLAPWKAATAAFGAAGVLVGGEALLPASTATTVRVRGGRVETMDGPFAESKEELGGYYLFECATLDEALKYAAMIPVHETGSVEVRPVMELPM